jgi:hypothetical protein
MKKRTVDARQSAKSARRSRNLHQRRNPGTHHSRNGENTRTPRAGWKRYASAILRLGTWNPKAAPVASFWYSGKPSRAEERTQGAPKQTVS